MKIKVLANEIRDGAIEFISLVKNGANRSPFKIVKAEEPQPSWAHLMPELAKLQKRLDSNEKTSKETTGMKIKDVIGQAEPVQKDNKTRGLEIAKLRERLNSLNNQWLSLQEQVTNPLFDRLNDDLSYQIQKAELELATLTVEEQDDLLTRSSAFFFRGGQSHVLQADASDSALDRRSTVSKTAATIDLSPINTQSDFNRINKADAEETDEIDLSGLVL